jgi:hypothetical protein
MMRGVVYAVRAAAIVLIAFGFSAQAERPLCAFATQALKAAERVRGLSAKQAVPCVVQNKRQIGAFVSTTIETDFPPDKLRMERVLYEALGIIPLHYDYAAGIVDLYANQIGGYYDPEKDRFVMASWIPGETQEGVAVHELTHALQDQYFDLDAFLDPALDSGDRLLARAALVEGDATAVMIDHARRIAGLPKLAVEEDISPLLAEIGMPLAGQVDTSGTPQALQRMLVFPYSAGLSFVHRLLREGGYAAVNEAYRRPPESTQEILHPDLYLARKKSPSVKPEELEPPASGGELLYTDTIGEFGISALLAPVLQSDSLAEKAALGWSGDLAGVFKTPSGMVVSWRTVWESDEDAREFTRAFTQCAELRSKNLATIKGPGVAPPPPATIKQVARVVLVTVESGLRGVPEFETKGVGKSGKQK